MAKLGQVLGLDCPPHPKKLLAGWQMGNMGASQHPSEFSQKPSPSKTSSCGAPTREPEPPRPGQPTRCEGLEQQPFGPSWGYS